MESTIKQKSRVRLATVLDIDPILAIEQSRRYDATNHSEGFLVKLMDGVELERFLGTRGKFLWVYDSGQHYEGGKGVEGYLAAYDKQEWLKNDRSLIEAEVNAEGKRILTGNWIYGRHIAKARDASGRIPIELENTFFDYAKEKGYPFAVAEIALAPFNERSYRFNTQAMGWQQIGTSKSKDVSWAIMCKKLSGGKNGN